MAYRVVNRFAAATWMVCAMVLGLAGCSSPAGQACERDADCDPGFECVSTGGVAFGDSICLLATAPSADSGLEDEGRDADAASPEDVGAEDVVDAPSDANTPDAHDAQDVDQPSDTDDADVHDDADVQSDADRDTDADADAGDPCLDFDAATCPELPGAVAVGCSNGACTYECEDGFFDENGDLHADESDGCEATECEPTNDGEEICDGIDNDCDGETDEELTRDCGTNRGACEAGTQTCSSGEWGDCEGGVRPTEEACNDRDDDCDGDTDENLSRSCGSDVGECRAGTQSCWNGNWMSWLCMGEIGPEPERCNGRDDDCDGEIDEGLGTRSCGSDVGACQEGTRSCEDGDWTSCQGEIEPTDELCDNGIDDDCDGQVDNCPCDYNGLSEGVCGEAMLDDDGDCERPDDYEDEEEMSCDGLDNDCDGEVDEGLRTRYYEDDDEDGFGESDESRVQCEPSGDYTALEGGDCDDWDDDIHPDATEVCDDEDNDCDGDVDEGVTTTYYHDDDRDGYGITDDSREDCDPWGDYRATESGDCDDDNEDINPGATEVCDEDIDYDCDGESSCPDE